MKTNLTYKIFSAVLCAALLLTGLSVTAQPVSAAAEQSIASPGPCRIRTDIELAWVYSIHTNYNSRTRLPGYSHVSGGMTPATIRLQNGKSNVQLPAAWITYVTRINNNNAVVVKYLFHANSGWQNSAQYARVEELAFENQWLTVLRVSGSRAYIKTFFTNETPPMYIDRTDSRVQLFTVVTRDNTIVGSPKGNAYIILIARPGEQLYIPTQYLDCPSRVPFTTKVHTPGARLNVRDAPGMSGVVMTTFDDKTPVTVFETATINGVVWGRITSTGSVPGWIALWLTDWGL